MHSDKALTNAELELTQRIQMYFPRGLLSSEKLHQWNSCPRAVLARHLAKMLQGDPNELDPHFPVWKTVGVWEGHKTPDDFRQALKQSGVRIGGSADDILGRTEYPASLSLFERREVKYDLALVSLGEMGLRNGARLDEILKRAAEFGLDPCHAAVALLLRLQYLDQRSNEWLHIAMEPITDSMGRPQIYTIGHGRSGLWLRGTYGGDDQSWRGGSHWVFVRRPNGN